MRATMEVHGAYMGGPDRKIRIRHKSKIKSQSGFSLFFLAFKLKVKHLKTETKFISPVERKPNKKYCRA
jgi:hypothetical protein